MSFNDIEVSLDDGTPAFVVEFTRTGKVWRYTNCEQDVTLAGDTYTSIPMTTTDVTQSGESSNDGVNFTIVNTCELAQYLDARKPSEDIGVKMRKLHLKAEENGEFSPPSTYADAPICWVGTFGTLKRPTPNQRLLACNTISISMARGGLRLAWQRSCHHFLYGRGCYVDKSLHMVSLTGGIAVVDGYNIVVVEPGAYPDGWFDGGYVEWESEPGVIERRAIELHTGNNFIMFGGTEGMEGGLGYVCYPGCNHTPDHCIDKFDNMNNYGGINFLQGRSPFDGDPVF